VKIIHFWPLQRPCFDPLIHISFSISHLYKPHFYKVKMGMLTLYSLSSPAKSLSRIWRVDVCIEEFVGKRRPQSLTYILVGPLVFLFWVIYYYGKMRTENTGVRLFASACNFQLNNNVEWDEVLWDELAYLQYTVVVGQDGSCWPFFFARGSQKNKTWPNIDIIAWRHVGRNGSTMNTCRKYFRAFMANIGNLTMNKNRGVLSVFSVH